MSWNLKAARFGLRLFQSLWNLTGTLAACESSRRRRKVREKRKIRFVPLSSLYLYCYYLIVGYIVFKIPENISISQPEILQTTFGAFLERSEHFVNEVSFKGYNCHKHHLLRKWLSVEDATRNHLLPSLRWVHVSPGHKWPLLLTWFNFNPSMDK